jgi:hypothetical protein
MASRWETRLRRTCNESESGAARSVRVPRSPAGVPGAGRPRCEPARRSPNASRASDGLGAQCEVEQRIDITRPAGARASLPFARSARPHSTDLSSPLALALASGRALRPNKGGTAGAQAPKGPSTSEGGQPTRLMAGRRATTGPSGGRGSGRIIGLLGRKRTSRLGCSISGSGTTRRCSIGG